MFKYIDTYLEDLRNMEKIINNISVLKRKSILVTGAGGLICSAIVDFLLELNEKSNYNIDIFVAARNEEKLHHRFGERFDSLHFLQYDAMEKINFEIRFDYIIHGASNANPSVYQNQPVETMMTNIIGTKNLLEYGIKMNVKRFVYISSSEIYGKKEENESYKENEYAYIDILNPRSCYPVSKRAAETLCASYRKEYGIDYVIVRPGHVYGPTMQENDNRVSSDFPKRIAKGENIILKSDGMQLRSYCYVLDCIAALLTVMLNGVCGEAYNISNRESIKTIRDMAECVAKIGKTEVVYQNASQVERERFNVMNNSSLDSEKLELLGWSGEFDLETGLNRTINHLRINYE